MTRKFVKRSNIFAILLESLICVSYCVALTEPDIQDCRLFSTKNYNNSFIWAENTKYNG